MPGLLKKKPPVRPGAIKVPRVRKVFAHILVRPPANPSNSAQTIRRVLGVKAKLSRRNPILRQFRFVINWGNRSRLDCNPGVRVFNKPEAITVASNKLTTFQRLQEANVRIPAFYTEAPPAAKNKIYLARTNLTGSCGVGITVIRPGQAMPKAPLYVDYIRKDLEYRVHVAGGEVIFVQQKRRRLENEQTEDQKLIRNYDNGWVFCPVDVADVAGDVRDIAVAAVAAVGLDFGAVDLVVSRNDNLPYVLEINTAPGIESPQLTDAYRLAFERMTT